jgi:hypothetical protein
MLPRDSIRKGHRLPFTLLAELNRFRRGRGKSAVWKEAIAAYLKRTSGVPNAWLAEALQMDFAILRQQVLRAHPPVRPPCP